MSRPFHDLGGEEADRIDRHEHEPSFYEKRIDAMLMLLSDQKRRLIRVDEHRRTMEECEADFYYSLPYYDRWLHSITSLMLEKGIITRDELEERKARARQALDRGEALP